MTATAPRVHVHAPLPDGYGVLRFRCPTCARRTYFLWTHVPWYGADSTCLRCGERWHDGERAVRPFLPGWREASKRHARERYRQLRRELPELQDFGKPPARQGEESASAA